MPRLDGTGPQGRGEMTGRGLGNCEGAAPVNNDAFYGRGIGLGLGRGRGCRGGRGFGAGYGRGYAADTEVAPLGRRRYVRRSR